MADFNLKDDLLGFGRAQLKYMLFYNSTLDALTDFTHRRGLFFYDTDLDSVEVIKDNTTGWNTFIHAISQNNPAYVADDDVMDRLAIGTKTYGQIRGYNPGFEGFLIVDEDGYPVNQAKILFENIEETDYTTVISAPGLDTRFATEKAIVDYVATQAVTPQNNILNWNGTRYLPYTNKLGSNPGYAYFYSSAVYPTFDNILNLDGTFRAYSVSARIASTSYAQLLSSGSLILYDFSNTFTISTNANDTAITSIKSGVHTPIYFGQTVLNDGTGFTLDIANNLLKLNTTTIRINSGTANKYLYLDGSKNITYVDAPAGGVTPVDNILDWDTDAYKPYTSKTASALYTGVTAPDAVATVLNYDGVFRATQLYEGATRVMTTHGTWTANGTLHAVTTSSHAGFCPQLPASSTGTFLRDNGTWATATNWLRSSGVLSPLVSTDRVAVITNAGVPITGSSTDYPGIRALSTNNYGISALSTNGIGGLISQAPSSTNIATEVLRLQRETSGTAAANIGAYISYSLSSLAASPVEASRIVTLLTDVTSAAESANLQWWLVNAGTMAKRMELTSAGQLIVPTLRVGTSSNYTEIEADGTIKFVGDATVWEDLNFAVVKSGGPAASLPADVTINNVYYKEFTSANNQSCGDEEEMPHNAKLSTNLHPHAHIFLKSGESAGTTGVTFTLYWELRESTGTTSGNLTMSATSAELTANPNKFDIWGTEFAGPTTLGSQLCLALYRTGGNAGDVVVTTYGVHYEIDLIGSREITTK